jgi:bifunctional non-homologous end joining protein LigD
MALEEYRAKRDLSKTPEPAAAAGKPHRRPIFVVQEHQATRLHYNFRLEADGVLKPVFYSNFVSFIASRT